MSTTTAKLGLFKPELTDPADITQMNRNWDILDDKVNNIPITSEVPSDAEMWIDPDDETVEESHLTNKNNPHGVTAEQVFAAGPAILSSFQYGTTLPADCTKGRIFFKKVSN